MPPETATPQTDTAQQPQSAESSPNPPASPSPSTSSGEMVKRDVAEVFARAVRVAAENRARHEKEAPQRLEVHVTRQRAASATEREAFEERMRQAAIAERVDAALRYCNVPTIYRNTDLRDLKGVPVASRNQYAQAVQAARKAVDRRPVIVALVGPRGPGKTTIACGLVLETCREGRSAKWLDVGDYFDFLKRTYGGNAKRDEIDVETDWLRPDLLAIDKLETAANTPWEDQKLQRLIVKRYENGKRTILVSNDTADALERRLGESVWDRLRDGGRVLSCLWPSLRGAVA